VRIKMEITNQTTCPKCSQREDFTIIDLLPMTPIENNKMRCQRCGKVWNLPEGFENVGN